jgi:hypothetical protein
MIGKCLSWFAFLSVAALGGCATQVGVTGGPRKPPQSTALATVFVIDGLEGPRLGSGELVVVGNAPIGVLNRRQYTWFQIQPGKVQLVISDPNRPSRRLASRAVDVEGGKYYYFRYIVPQSNLLSIVEMVNALKSPPPEIANYNSEDLRPISPEVASVLIDAYEAAGNQMQK